MTILVTGSAGHLGEALVRTFRELGRPVRGFDRLHSPFTDLVGSINDVPLVAEAMHDIEAVLHVATLHKPHVTTHSPQAFIDANVSGTQTLLEAAHRAKAKAFVFTSTTSVFGDALVPPKGAPAAWVTEETRPVPKNIYGVTKAAAEDLCQLAFRNLQLPCVVLRTSRFFPEADDDPIARESYEDANLKVNELLHRRVDLEDVVSAHLRALERCADIGFGKFIISATTPFEREDCAEIRHDLPAVLDRRVPGWRAPYEKAGWKMAPYFDRIYDNAHARKVLGWEPKHDFRSVASSGEVLSPLARAVGSKGYHR
jgi:nucleoside-diphosphate-sugar epimerase